MARIVDPAQQLLPFAEPEILNPSQPRRRHLCEAQKSKPRERLETRTTVTVHQAPEERYSETTIEINRKKDPFLFYKKRQINAPANEESSVKKAVGKNLVKIVKAVIATAAATSVGASPTGHDGLRCFPTHQQTTVRTSAPNVWVTEVCPEKQSTVVTSRSH